ncbi:uncharacterized protein [Medicago truncatula]|uniref:uncharacterized protein isoform X1 n=1 Tax=Medicago truncatula TaxID=3880 RepID=UPI000D2F17F4|nr:uncharacterized protein LOC112422521 isoform X1 [Medicago truncatula]
MKAPPSVQNFLWRLAKDILPTRSRLRRKGVLNDTICPLCFEEEETPEHLFMCCRFSQQTCFSLTLGLHVPSHCCLKLWMSDWLNKKDHLAAQIFGITLWKIWQGRNQLLFQHQQFNPIQIVLSAVDFIYEFNAANITVAAVSRVINSPASWSPPPSGALQLNVDAACFKDESVGSGMVIRDNRGAVEFAATKLEKRQLSPNLAEALALRWCLQWILTTNQEGKFIIESDSEVTVNCLKGRNLLADVDNVIFVVIFSLSFPIVM